MPTTYTLYISDHGDLIARIPDLPTIEDCIKHIPGHGGRCCCTISTARCEATVQYDDSSKTWLLYDGPTDRFQPSTKAKAIAHFKRWLD